MLLLRVPDPAAPPAPAANSLLDRVAGAQIRYVSFAEYRRRDEIFAVVEEDLRRAGRRPYRIPEGGSNALGAWGYVAALEELREQIAALGAADAPPPITIAYAAGSGGTGAGIELGLRLTGWTDARALGFAVCDDRAFFQQRIADIAGDASRRWNLGVALAPDDVAIDDRFIGPGYAQTTPEMLARDLPRSRAPTGRSWTRCTPARRFSVCARRSNDRELAREGHGRLSPHGWNLWTISLRGRPGSATCVDD